MKLEVGMYIRSPKGVIEKIDYLVKQDNPFWPYTINCTPRMSGDIAKASHNIIDLIEKCDYVNGYKVENIEDNGRFKVLIIDIGNNYEHILYDCFIEDGSFLEIREEQIETILTHEVFEREVYKIE